MRSAVEDHKHVIPVTHNSWVRTVVIAIKRTQETVGLQWLLCMAIICVNDRCLVELSTSFLNAKRPRGKWRIEVQET